MAGENRHSYVRQFITGRQEDHLRELSQIANNALKGKTNNFFRVTLTPDEIETVVDVEFASVGAVATLTAISASASAAGGVWTEVQTGLIRIHHDADPATDRTFGVVLTG